MLRDDEGKPLPDEFVEHVARRFAVLSDPTRIRLLDALHVNGEASVTELATRIDAPHANVSKHLNLLYAAGIVGRRKDGTRFIYALTDETVIEICDLVCDGVRRRLESLGQLGGFAR